MNIRLWVPCHASVARITLGPDEHIEFGHSESTDEGWASEGYLFEREGDLVYMTCYSDGVDCDGRMSREARFVVTLNELECKPSEVHEGLLMPNWIDVNSCQRDYAAESAGY